MLKAYPRFDTILMPLHIADPAYLSFEKLVLPLAIRQNLGIQGMKNFANAKLLQSFSAGECLNYVLSLPIHCTTVGCTTLGQLEDDVRIAREFSPYSPQQMASLRRRAQGIKGPGLEDWKRDVEVRVGMGPSPPLPGGMSGSGSDVVDLAESVGSQQVPFLDLQAGVQGFDHGDGFGSGLKVEQ